MLPHSMQIEQALIATFIMDSRLAADHLENINPDLFYTPIYKVVIKCMRELILDFQPTEMQLIYEQLKRLGMDSKFDQMGGFSEFIGKDVHQSIIQDYFTELKGFWKVRIVVEACQEIITRARKANTEEIDAFMEHFNAVSAKILNMISTDINEHASKVVKRVVLEIEKSFKNNTPPTGTPSGFMDLDAVLGGFQDSHLIILAARPAMGKTALALQLFRNASKNNDKTAVMFSLEMTSDELMKRMLAFESKIHGRNIQKAKLTANDFENLYPSVAKITDSKMYFIDQPGLTITDIIIQCRKIKKIQGELGFVVVDYLQLVHGESKKADNREREISQISMGLKALAKELKCPVIALSQLNRGLESRPEKRPMTSDLRESGSIEQDADVVLLLYRDEVYNKESPDKGIAEVIIGKNRHGETGTVKLSFIKEFPAFFNLANIQER